jgi:hypothetical protein
VGLASSARAIVLSRAESPKSVTALKYNKKLGFLADIPAFNCGGGLKKSF